MRKLKLMSKIIIFTIIFFLSFLITDHHFAEDKKYIYVDQGMTLVDVSDRLDYFDDVLFYDSNNNSIKDYYMIAKTGIKVSCFKEDICYEYKIVIKGDVNGDGIIDRSDIHTIKCSMVGLSTLENEYLEACDNNADSSVSLQDLFITNQYIKNQNTLEEETTIEISKIELNETSLNLKVEETANLTYTITPEHSTDTDVNYFSMDSNIVNVDDNGLVTAVNNGFTQILATCASGARAICDVTVHTEPKEIEIDKKEIELFINGEDSYLLKPSFKPSTADIMTGLSWESSDLEIVSVDEKGTLVAKKNGTATIKVTSENKLETSCEVTVKTKPSELIMPSQVSLEKGKTTKIDTIINPKTANSDTEIIWRTDNKNIINIDEDGTITGMEDGTATIRAYTKNGKRADCTINVYTKINDMILSTESVTMDLSQNKTCKIFANSDAGKDITNILTWQSANTEIATVNETGEITAIANGTTTITASLNEELNKTVSITVQTSPKQIELNKTMTSLIIGEIEQLSYTVTPHTSNIHHKVTWTSSNSNVVTVNDAGLLEAKGVGKAVITAQTENNMIASCFVNVTRTPSSMLFNQSSIIMEKNATRQILLTFDTNLNEMNLDSLKIRTPNNSNIISYTYDTYSANQIQVSITGIQDGHTYIMASMDGAFSFCEVIVYTNLNFLDLYIGENLVSNTSNNVDLSTNPSIFTVKASLNEEKSDVSRVVTWNSSNPQVISINNKGEAIIHSTGSTIISAQLKDTLTASFTLTIQASPKAIDIPSTVNLYVNGTNTYQIKPTITPANTTIQNTITYSSSNPNVASVNTSGNVTAHASGNAIITATTQNGKTDTCSVTVRTAPAQIAFDTSTKYLKQGGSMTLKASISPNHADVQNRISWSSSNANIVSVDNLGNIVAKQKGSATITAKTENNKIATIQIIVPDLSVTINQSTLDLTTLPSTNIVSTNSKNIGKLSYVSNNTAIATVDANGKVTAKNNGNTTIIVTETNANTQVTIPISVKTSTKSLSMNQTSASLDIVNTTVQLSATHAPATVSSKAITWSSSNTKVATVNNGKITRVGTGTAIITAKANDGSNKIATCTITVKEEKLIIAGASTVVQLAGRRTCSTKTGVYANINYYNTYGYKVRSTNTWNSKYYSSFQSHTGLNDKNADLFFVCEGGTGYKWLAGKKPKKYYTDTGTAGEGREKIDRIIKENPNCHFTVAFMHGGNDLKGPSSQAEVDEIAKTYANYYKSLAKTYSAHHFYIFPPTPVDDASASDNKKKSGYNSTFSNNTKRYRFATRLNAELKNVGNLKYATNFYNNMKKSSKYKCYDGNHYQKNTAKFVLDTILDECKVLKSNKKK